MVLLGEYHLNSWLLLNNHLIIDIDIFSTVALHSVLLKVIYLLAMLKVTLMTVFIILVSIGSLLVHKLVIFTLL